MKNFKWTGWTISGVNLPKTGKETYYMFGGDFAKDEEGNHILREECNKCSLFLDDSDFHDENGNCLD